MTDLIGFDKNDSAALSSRDVEKYRGEEGNKDLISICWFFEDEDGNLMMGEDDTPKFSAVEYHYIQGLGYIKTNDYLKKKVGAPKLRMGTFVVQYKTDSNGKLAKPFEYEVKLWDFGQDKYRDLKNINDDFPLTQHDIKVQCKDKQFQKLTFMPSPKEALWQRKPEIKQAVLDRVRAIEDQMDLARTLPEEELKDHFGDNDGPVDASSDVDYDDVTFDLED